MIGHPLTRGEAIAAGATRYVGESCRAGHAGERYTRNGTCIACQQAFKSKWRRENADAHRAHVTRWREDKRPSKLASDARRRAIKLKCLGELSQSERDAIERLYEEREALGVLRGVPHHVDHLPALSRGGKHHPAFMQVMTAEANLKAGAKERQRPGFANVALFEGDPRNIPHDKADAAWGEYQGA